LLNINYKFVYKIILLSIVFLFISCKTKSSQVDKPVETIKASKANDTISFDYDSRISELKKLLSDEFIFKSLSCFVISSNMSETETQRIIDNTITSAEECFYNNYFEKKPDELITIFLFKDDKSYRYWAKKLYGDTDLSRFGYYKPSKKTMLMNISTGGGTLVHEMTHAFVRYDFPDIPSWFNEGLGSLYERCSMNNKEILGHTNWRLPELKDAIKNNLYNSLDWLVSTNDEEFYGYESSLNYSQARYLCQYLQQKNLLKKFYKAFRDNYDKDKTGKTFLEEVTKMKLADLDYVYVEWVKTLRNE
jgi:hypothetical protein